MLQVASPNPLKAGDLEGQGSGPVAPSPTTSRSLSGRQSQAAGNDWFAPTASGSTCPPPPQDSLSQGLSSGSDTQPFPDSKPLSALRKAGSGCDSAVAGSDASWSARGASAFHELKAGLRSLVLASGPSYTAAGGAAAGPRPNPFGREVRFAVGSPEQGPPSPLAAALSGGSGIPYGGDGSVSAAAGGGAAADSAELEHLDSESSAKARARKKNKSMGNLKALLKAAVKGVAGSMPRSKSGYLGGERWVVPTSKEHSCGLQQNSSTLMVTS